ncbi:MAG TPA: ABC transporter substrate-binding protein [Blastocatellia bacterium]|nr:ABC transporter substrate-binding protein [Blastocatellia bacterium]
MRRLTVLIAISVISVFAQAPGGAHPQTDPLSSQERRGKEIYFGIAGSSPPIKALIGDPPTEAPGTLMACANCHGLDGKGKPEGGVVPSDITWETLTKPYPLTNSSGRTHPRYTERLFVSAVCMGIDPAGNKLHVAMPRFQMSREDINALIAYLKRLGRDIDPGLSESTIRIGTVLPTTGPLAEAGRAIESILIAYIDEINKQGGIYNRKVELSKAELGRSPAESATNVEKFINEERPFALVAALTAGAEKEIVAACERSQVPLVGPVTVFAETGYPANRHTFYLLSGVEQQARALIHYSRQSLKGHNSRIAIVYSHEVVGDQIIEAIQRYCKQSGQEAAITIDGQSEGFASDSLVKKTRSADADLTLLLASSREAELFARTAEKAGWMPLLLIPGSLATNELLDLRGGLAKRVFVALPSLPSDQTQAGISEYRVLSKNYHLPKAEIVSQITALCSIKVLEQGLKLAGRAVTREKLVTALEGLYDFDTGLMPRIGFGPDRRIGALGAYIVTLDSDNKQFRPVSGWLRLD